MFKVTNVSNMPLTISDGKLLAPGETRKIAKPNDRDRGLAGKGWLMIKEQTAPAQTPKSDEGKSTAANTGGKK